MGNGIAQTFAASGQRVLLMEANVAALTRGLASMLVSLWRFVEGG
jgi:3-hydroxyacyl-CoA dehydrogenase